MKRPGLCGSQDRFVTLWENRASGSESRDHSSGRKGGEGEAPLKRDTHGSRCTNTWRIAKKNTGRGKRDSCSGAANESQVRKGASRAAPRPVGRRLQNQNVPRVLITRGRPLRPKRVQARQAEGEGNVDANSSSAATACKKPYSFRGRKGAAEAKAIHPLTKRGEELESVGKTREQEYLEEGARDRKKQDSSPKDG